MAKNSNSVACCADGGVQRDSSQIKSKDRVAERGEVLQPKGR